MGAEERPKSLISFTSPAEAERLLDMLRATPAEGYAACCEAIGAFGFGIAPEEFDRILDTDVTVDGTAFVYGAKDVTLDLNGHTITYDNAPPILFQTLLDHDYGGPMADSGTAILVLTALQVTGGHLTLYLYGGFYS